MTNVGWLDLNGAGRVHDGITVAVIAVFAVLIVTKLVRRAPGRSACSCRSLAALADARAQPSHRSGDRLRLHEVRQLTPDEEEPPAEEAMPLVVALPELAR